MGGGLNLQLEECWEKELVPYEEKKYGGGFKSPPPWPRPFILISGGSWNMASHWFIML